MKVLIKNPPFKFWRRVEVNISSKELSYNCPLNVAFKILCINCKTEVLPPKEPKRNSHDRQTRLLRIQSPYQINNYVNSFQLWLTLSSTRPCTLTLTDSTCALVLMWSRAARIPWQHSSWAYKTGAANPHDPGEAPFTSITVAYIPSYYQWCHELFLFIIKWGPHLHHDLYFEIQFKIHQCFEISGINSNAYHHKSNTSRNYSKLPWVESSGTTEGDSK